MTWDVKACEGKKKYTKKDALTIRNLRQSGHRQAEQGLNIYPCPFGDHWHLSSVKRKRNSNAGRIKWSKWR